MQNTLHSSGPLPLCQLYLFLILVRPISQTDWTTLSRLADWDLALGTGGAGHGVAVHDTAVLACAGFTQGSVVPGRSVVDKLTLVHALTICCVYTLTVL